MKYRVVEWYTDVLCPSGDNDFVVRSEDIEASSVDEAKLVYELRNNIDANNELRVYPIS